jgi:chlorite dismutase
MRWIKIGSRKYGVEAAYIQGSAIFMYLMHSYSLDHRQSSSWESPLFFFIFTYNVLAYVSLVLSEPGRINDTHYRKEIDKLVSDRYYLTFYSFKHSK